LSESLLRLVVGLGNPGKEYEHTRHNLGFLAVSRLAKEHGLKWAKSASCKGFVAEGEVDAMETVLLLPLTYVNNSGIAVGGIAHKKNIAPENILVICDDLNLDFGDIRIRPEGSAGGHNGLSSVIEHLKTNKFPRLRMGIGRPHATGGTKDFVLSGFDKTEKAHLGALIEEAVLCSEEWLTEGTTKAMSRFNKRKGNG